MLFLVLLAPVAQRIEHWPPEPGARVRVPSGALCNWAVLKRGRSDRSGRYGDTQNRTGNQDYTASLYDEEVLSYG